MTGDPHHRFRARIDQIAAERDQALELAAEAIEERDAAVERLTSVVTTNQRYRQRIRILERSREFWRNRWLTTGIHGRWRKR